MTLLGRIEKLEDAFDLNRNAADEFELSRPEVLGVMSRLMVRPSPGNGVTEELQEQLRWLLERHERNAMRKHGESRVPSLPEVFEAAHTGEKFCCDIAAIFARAEACGILWPDAGARTE
jgi:hypothetical protein